MSKAKLNQYPLWFAIILMLGCLVGCGGAMELPAAQQPSEQVTAGLKQKPGMGMTADGHICSSDEACGSGFCADPGMGRKVCTQECDINRPCGRGFSCASGICMPSCQRDNDCDRFPGTPICVAGGVCWRDGQ